MSVASEFSSFCQNLRIEDNVISNISSRYKRMTKQLNRDFWTTDSDTNHSLFVGSYGRDTEIHSSDIDMLFRLPYSVYERFQGYTGNKQSALIAEVRESIKKTYSITHIRGDGQVIIVPFDDKITFEIVPAFLNNDDSFTYPDSNNGGSWKTTDPQPEIKAIQVGNNLWNKNLKELCRMTRAWKETWDVPIGGLLIDTLAYNFMKDWEYRDKSYLYYDWLVRDFFDYLKSQNEEQKYWYAIGSGQKVYRKGNFEYKALRCYNLSVDAIDYQSRNMPFSAKSKWKEIFGSKFK